MMKVRIAALRYLALSVTTISLAFVSEIKLGHHTKTIWPITAHYVFPNACMLCAYVFVMFFFIAVIAWLISGDK